MIHSFVTRAFLTAGLLAAASAAQGVIFESYRFTDSPLPLNPVDGGGVPVTDTRILDSNIIALTDVNVVLRLTNPTQGGAYNGDFLVTLVNDNGFAVLLNRVGRRDGVLPSETLGYSDNGFDVVFDDDAANGDVHVYRLTLEGSHTAPIDPLFNAPLTGTWAPDGRSPLAGTPVIGVPRTELLSSFNGSAASGAWTLSVADLNVGGTATLFEWGLDLVGTPVPEPEWAAVVLLLGALGWHRWMRRSGAARV
ncbi:MAG: hypothetical protein KF833_02260 [Verrucomicrobiae bacterium]|nr:hypothetical protein [Verrucomicrobiae bacterium]